MSLFKIDSFSGKNRFLSNFYFHEGWCVEIPFQAAKTHDNTKQARILMAKSPAEAKKLGRSAVLRKDWEEVKVDVMLLLLRKKFKIPAMREKLIATSDKELIEGNWWHDNEWGDCNCKKCANIPGKNKLGKLLMHVRQEIILNYAFGRTEETWEELPYEEDKGK